MSQAHVEQIIGRFVTDDQWRARYCEGPDAAVDGLAQVDGLEVTATERRALVTLPAAALDALAGVVDPRLRRLAVRR